MVTRNFSFKRLLLLLLSFSLTGCITNYYSTNPQNIPLFKKSNEKYFSGSYHIGTPSQGFNLQAAHSLTNHIGWLINYSYWGAKWKDNEPWYSKGSNNGNTFEFGLGYFLLLNEKTVFETYGGFGFSSVSNTYENDAKSRASGNIFFIQPAIGFHTKSTTIGGSLRFTGLNYYKFKYKGNNYGAPLETFEQLRNDPFSAYIEPCFILRTGNSKDIKFQLQAGFSIPVTKTKSSDLFFISIGFLLF